MATGRDDEPKDHEPEQWDEEPPRSILSSTWFRVLIIVLVVAGAAAIAVPYVMEMSAPPLLRHAAAPVKPADKPVTTLVPTPTQAPKPPPPTPAQTPTPAPAASAAAPAPSARETTAAKPAVTAAVNAADDARKTMAPKPDTRVAQATKSDAAKPETTKPDAAKPDATKSEKPAASAQKSEPQKSDATKSEPTKTPSRKSRRAVKSATASAAKNGSGEYWVQVGAFRDPATAEKLAATLKERGFSVKESATASSAAGGPVAAPKKATSAADRYDVIVTGATPADAAQKLTAKGLSAETVSDGAAVRPSLPLRDAIALANDLRADGLKVSVRRVRAGAGKSPQPAASASASAGQTLHRVRVGGFADRAAARAAAQKLEALGYKPFIARGGE
jgi:cell division septation protein DedD